MYNPTFPDKLQPGDALASELRGFIESFERVLRTQVCFHDYTGRVLALLGMKYKHHFSTFCANVKKTGQKAVNRCMECDMHLVARRLSTCARPFFKICHGQVGEVVIPLVYGGTLGGAYFVGPFRWETDRDYPESFLVQTASARERDRYKNGRMKLRVLSRGDLEDIIRLGSMLAQHTVAAIASVETSRNQHAQGYKERIESYVNEHLGGGITRSDLARHLCLSESRVSRLVRTNFAQSLPRLVAARRIEYARQLLKNTSLTIETISRHAGVEDSLYFYRIFRRETGMTPRQFRQTVSTGE